MNKKFDYQSLKYSDLNQNQKIIIDKAKYAVKGAYAPYSNYKVGSAVELENGEIILGNNQENAAYPSGLCAERVAIYAAKSQYPNQRIKRVAIHSSEEFLDSSVAPCGSCRQSILEYEVNQKDPIELIFQGEEGRYIIVQSVKDLLPFYFDKTRL